MSFLFPFFSLPVEAYYISSAYFQSDILTSQISLKLLAKFHGFNDKSEFSSWHVTRNTVSSHVLECPKFPTYCSRVKQKETLNLVSSTMFLTLT